MEWRQWLVSASAASFGVAIAILVGVLAGPGCQSPCSGDFDCVGAGYCDQVTGRCQQDCFTDDDCRSPPQCRDNPSACKPLGLYCSGTGRCLGPVTIDFEGVTTSAPRAGGPRSIEGWDDQPGIGYSFIVDTLAFADRDRGYDLDGECGPSGCVDNILWPLADLTNNQIQAGLNRGESLLLLELAGLDDAPYTGFDESFTIKVYAGEDADEPIFPANNFSRPPGVNSCCEFRLSTKSIVSPPRQAKSRAPAELDRGRFRSLAPVPIQFTITLGAEPHPEVRIENVLLNGRLGRELATIEQGLMGGAAPITTLFSTVNPHCREPSPTCPLTFPNSDTLLDLVASLDFQPDIDLDRDGRECLIDEDGDGDIDLCCDGRGVGSGCDSTNPSCPGFEVEAVDPSDPSSCALPPQMDDGYSLAFEFSAVRATVAGSSD